MESRAGALVDSAGSALAEGRRIANGDDADAASAGRGIAGVVATRSWRTRAVVAAAPALDLDARAGVDVGADRCTNAAKSERKRLHVSVFLVVIGYASR